MCLELTLDSVNRLLFVWLNVWLMPIIKCHIDRRSIESATKQQRELRQKVILVDPSGLRLAINAKSASWNYNYRKRGVDYYGKRHPQRTLRLGDTVSMTPQEARLRVEEVKAEVRSGGDPANSLSREAAEKRRKEYLQRPLSDWLFQYRRSVLKDVTKHKREEFMHAQKALVELGMDGASPLELTARVLRELVSIHADKPATGRHRFGAMSRFLDYLVDEEVVEHNAAQGVSRRLRPKAPEARETYYTIDQLGQLWFPRNQLRADYLRFLRFMIVCPLRMSEAAELTGSNIYLDATELRLSAKETKNSQAFTLPLPDLAIGLLQQHAITPAARCFQLSSKEGASMKSWTYFNKFVRHATGVEHFNLHDLRRTFVTMLSEHSSFSEGLVDSLLNHSRSGSRTGVLRHYQHAKNLKQRREVMSWWESFLLSEVIKNEDQCHEED